MKAQFKVNPSLVIEMEEEKQKDLFGAMAQVYEVFGEKECGLCQSKSIKPVVRTVTKGKKVYEYPEWVCNDCFGKLTLSYHLEGGTMFPNRKLLPNGQPATGDDRERGSYGPHNGWTKYRGETSEEKAGG